MTNGEAMLALLVVIVVCADIASSVKHNVVILMADDWGYGDWSRTGAPAITPNLEAMSRADTAGWFERSYSGNPICSPTRASVMTGRTPARTCIYGVEQHILCHETPNQIGGCLRGEFSLGNASKTKGYNTGFYGKWHMGSLRNSSADCYDPKGASCLPGFVSWGSGDDQVCCQGNDGHLMVSNPHHFGFDEWVATPQCGPSGTTNCGCFFTPANPTPPDSCVVGHYNNSCETCNKHLECAQYYVGNTSAVPAQTTYTTEPMTEVSDANDENFLVSKLESLAVRSVSTGTPFLGVVFFHGVHIPYVADDEYKAMYKNVTSPLSGKKMDENEQDYWGTVSQIDAAVGRVRAMLKRLGIADTTWLSLHADNGPEVSPANGQGTGTPFTNPGGTDGLRGRKRDLTEGGIREIGLVEYPPLVKKNFHETRYPIVTMDLMATVLDILNMTSYEGRPLDGYSLLPYLSGQVAAGGRPQGIGWYGSFGYGSTNHANPQYPNQPGTGSKGCPFFSTAQSVGDVPANFSTPGNQPQWAWTDNDYKLFGCKEKQGSWHFFMYNLVTDRNESIDLWASDQSRAQSMLADFMKWQASVYHSQTAAEIGCLDPMLPVPYYPVANMQNVKARCESENGNQLGSKSASSETECASDCHLTESCEFMSFSDQANECWLYKDCNSMDKGNFVYTWSTYTLKKPMFSP